ncbi:MAG: glycine betaine ABC transporter substrate-binding protein, partial [Bacteroidota bacterium]
LMPFLVNLKLLLLDIRTDVEAGLSPEGEIIIGSKTFTESYILAHVFAQLIEYETGIKTSLKLGFGGTKLLFDALKYDEVHLYPEYTGTGFLVILNPPNETVTKLISNKDSVYNYVQREFQREYGISWLKPLGFNNTYAMLMRKEQANDLQLKTISDLADYLNQ